MSKITWEELGEKADKISKRVEALCVAMDQRAKDHKVWLEDMKKLNAEFDILRSQLDPKGEETVK